MSRPLQKKSSYRFGECGGQLRPRFVPQEPKLDAKLVFQGLDLPTPPLGRRLRSIFEHCDATTNTQVCDAMSVNGTTEWPSIIHSLLSPKPSRRVRVRSSSSGNGMVNKVMITVFTTFHLHSWSITISNVFTKWLLDYFQPRRYQACFLNIFALLSWDFFLSYCLIYYSMLFRTVFQSGRAPRGLTETRSHSGTWTVFMRHLSTREFEL